MAKVELMAAGKIGGLIEAAHKADAEFGQVLHTAAVQCLAHCEKHGDRTLIARLLGGKVMDKDNKRVVEDFPEVLKSVSAREIRIWVGKFSPLMYRNGVWAVRKGAQAPGFDIEAANKHPYWALPENQADRNREIGMDNLQNVIFGVRKRFENALKEGKFTGDPVAMRQYLDTIEAIAIPKVNDKRVIKADFKPHDDKEVISLQGVKAARAASAALSGTLQAVPPPEALERRA